MKRRNGEGFCPYCGLIIAKRKDGRLYPHSRLTSHRATTERTERCPGSGEKP